MTEEQLIREIRKMYPTDTSVTIFVAHQEYEIHRNRKLGTLGSSWNQIDGRTSPRVSAFEANEPQKGNEKEKNDDHDSAKQDG